MPGHFFATQALVSVRTCHEKVFMTLRFNKRRGVAANVILGPRFDHEKTSLPRMCDARFAKCRLGSLGCSVQEHYESTG
jgi:hypothetical protein